MLNKLFAFLMRFYNDERGEAGTEIEEPDDGSISTEVDNPDYVPEDEDKALGDGSDDEPEDEQGDEEEEPEKDDDDPLKALETKLRSEFDEKLKEKDDLLEKREKEINRLGYALRTGSKSTDGDKKGATDEPQFTDAQLISILQEHKDDPTVLLQVMKEISNVKGREVEASAEKAADIKQKLNQMEKYVSDNFPEMTSEGTKEHEALQKTIEFMHLDGHPFAKYLAIATLQAQQIPKLIEKIKEDTKKELLGKKVEENRKKGIKNNTPAGDKTAGGKKVPALSKTQKETVALLFPNDAKLQAKYARLVNQKNGTFTANVQ